MNNAYKGVKKIYRAEILAIISALAILVSAVLSMTINDPKAILAAYITSAVLEAIEFILIFIGANQAVKYEKNFRSVRFIVVALVIITVLQMVFTNNILLSKGLVVANNVLELFLILCVIKACVSMADRLKNKEVSEKGKNVVKIAIVTFFISIALYLTIYVIGAKSGGVITVISDTMEMIIILASILIIIIAYFMYVIMLSKAVKMLGEYID